MGLSAVEKVARGTGLEKGWRGGCLRRCAQGRRPWWPRADLCAEKAASGGGTPARARVVACAGRRGGGAVAGHAADSRGSKCPRCGAQPAALHGSRLPRQAACASADWPGRPLRICSAAVGDERPARQRRPDPPHPPSSPPVPVAAFIQLLQTDNSVFLKPRDQTNRGNGFQFLSNTVRTCGSPSIPGPRARPSHRHHPEGAGGSRPPPGPVGSRGDAVLSACA